MDVVRRNTDYAIRLVLNLAKRNENGPISTRTAASEEDVPEPAKMSLLEVIEVIQGPLRLNRCLFGVDVCPRQKGCPVTAKLAKLQKYIGNYLGGITLDELLRGRRAKNKGRKKKRKR